VLEAQKNVAMLSLESEVRREDQYNPLITEDSFENLMFYVPVEGVISQFYDPLSDHLAIDIAAKAGSAVKAVADATVIHAEWSTATGYNLILIHQNNMLSVYKHNGELFKKQGDAVRAGEVIALVGNTGELSTGAHLHFELWRGGKPIDPQNYINF
jgi:murein DD-endopeptidase MepM/ murein hydrolase activator NlpD